MTKPAPNDATPQPRLSTSWRDRIFLGLVLAIGSTLTLLAGSSLQQSEALRLAEKKTEATQAVVGALELELARTTEAIRNAGLMLESNPQITPDQFNRYMQSVVENQLNLSLMEWQPIVPAKQLAQFESAARALGLTDYRVVQPDASGKGWQPVHGRDEYVPVLFAWPASYRTAGMDMSFSPERMASKLQSRSIAQPVSSGVFPFMKEGMVNSGTKAVAISTAVFGDNRSARGYLAAVVDLHTLFQKASRLADSVKMDLLIFSTATPAAAPIYAWYGDDSGVTHQTAEAMVTRAEEESATMNFAHQSLKIVLHPRPGFYAALPAKAAPLVYAFGSAMTLLLLAILAAHLRTNAQLSREIFSRSVADKALQHRQLMMERSESVARMASFEWDVDTNIVTWSPEMFHIFGRDPAQGIPNLQGQAELYTPESTQTLFDAVGKAVADGAAYELELMTRQPNGELRPCRIKGFPERDASGRVVRLTGLLQDITERKRVENYERFRNHILELLAANEPLPALFEAILRGVEKLHPEMLCSLLLLDSEGRHLGKGVAPSLPDFYNEALDGIEIGIGVGSCGTAAFTGERVIVADIATHPYWTPYKDLAASAGLGACWSQPIRAASGQVLGTFAIYHRRANAPEASDIYLIEQCARFISIALERKAGSEKLLQSEMRLRTLFEHAAVGVALLDTASGRFIQVNQKYGDIIGYSQSEMLALDFQTITHPDDLQADLDNMERLKAGLIPAFEMEKRYLTKEGKTVWVKLTVSPMWQPGAHADQHIAVVQDISAQKLAETEINSLAFYDPLTRLPNRRLFLDRLAQAVTASARHEHYGALLFIDLDNFKNVNDTLGHNVGDLLLQQVAQRLTASVREGDTVGRLGGDEFVVMLEDLSAVATDAATETEMVGEKILALLNQPYQLNDHLHHSTPSIGVTLFARHHGTLDDLLKRADLAMYRAKAAGRNTVRFFDQEMQTVVMARAALESALREALLNENFVVHFQAQVNEVGDLTGGEVLVRWQHPERGIISPAEFIPLAEETGLILPLGHWVLKTACEQLATWSTCPDMAHLTIAVNVSARQFMLPTFVDEVLTLLEHTGATPQRLKLELTESLLVGDMEDIISKMTALKTQGVGFALDDFGTGYSSLSYLKRLPLDQLKIDQGFVRNILTDANDSAIAKMVIVLAESMGLAVIAEGVETTAQKEHLSRLGCQAYQGYLFSRPLPLGEFEAFARRGGGRPVTA